MTARATASAAPNLTVLPASITLRRLHATMRDRSTDRTTFRDAADAVGILLVHAALDGLPHVEREVRTPVGGVYPGLALADPVVGVSVIRAGEALETAFRGLLPGADIGKILIQRDKVTKLPHLYYHHLPPRIAEARVLLFEPMLATGGSALEAIAVLERAGVAEDRITVLSVLSVPEGIAAVTRRRPRVRFVISAVDQGLDANAYMVPGMGDFGDRYFGTDARRAEGA